MKKIIIYFGLTFLLLGLSFPAFAHCQNHYINESDCGEVWCVNAGANSPIECVCGTSVRIYCYGGPQQ